MLKHHFGFLVAGAFLITAAVGEAKWYTARDGTYFVIDPDAKVNWYDALINCATRNLSLVTSPSEEKYMALKELLRVVADSPVDFWIDGVYSSDDDQYYWAETGSQFDYTYWKEGYPVNKNIKQCVNIEDSDFLWVNSDCDNKIGLLCEKQDVDSLEALVTMLKDAKSRINYLAEILLAKLKQIKIT